MGKAKEQLDVLGVFRRKAELRAERLGLEKQVKEIKAEEDLLEAALEANIPVGKTVQGVLHTVSTKKTPVWSKILPLMKEQLIPKTKWETADKLIDENSTVSETHVFKSEL